MQKDDMAQRHAKCEVGIHKVRRAKGKHDIMIRAYRSVLKKIEKLPKIFVHNLEYLYVNTKCTKVGS